MAKTPRIKTLESLLQKIAKPALSIKGFSYDTKSRVFRRKFGECTQIIEVQAGMRSYEGKFTVNLAVFHPQYNEIKEEIVPDNKIRGYHCLFDYRKRLAVLRDTPFTRFFKYFIKDNEHWFKWLLITPSDKWWKFSHNENEVSKTIERVLELLEKKGCTWLDENSNPQDMMVNYQMLQQQKR